jgi:predicted restriction endonuclease
MKPQQGRLVVGWQNEISWARWAEANQFPVLETFPASKFVGSVATDIEAVKKARDIEETERRALIAARIGQGQFRNILMTIWKSRCAVTECETSEVLRASHIQPWKFSTNEERLDPQNGLLLSANLDALFDRGLIAFAKDGKMLVSECLSDKERRVLGLHVDSELRMSVSPTTKAYLKWHREYWTFD